MSSPGENERTYPAQNLCKRVTIYDDEQELENLLPDPSGFAAEADCENSIDDVGVPASSTRQAARTSNRIESSPGTILHNPRLDAHRREEEVPPSYSLTAAERLTANWRPKKCGLNNVGNTCYMNAALQCLFCTTELAHFFLRGFYKKELNIDNPLGWQGRVAECFRLLVDDVHSHTETWAPRRNEWGYVTHSVEPAKFKRVIAPLNGGMFAGFQQQDSQELLGAVLDGIHEDCNRIKKKPYVENVVGDGTNDTDVAREAWDRYKMRNDSFVVDTFQGQMRSRVTCTECQNMSVSFDPSMYLGLSFKQVVQPISLRVVVKFESPKMCRPLEQLPFDDIPQGFHYDCDVKVFPGPADTFGSLVKLFEERSPGCRFIVVTLIRLAGRIVAFDTLIPESTSLPRERTCYEEYCILEVPGLVADGWIEADRLSRASTSARTRRTFTVAREKHYDSNSVECSEEPADRAQEQAPGPMWPKQLSSLINLIKLMFNRGQSNHLCQFLARMKVEEAQKQRQRQHTSSDDDDDDDEPDSSSSAPSVNGSSRIPILVVQRQKGIEPMYMQERYTLVDVPHYIWVEDKTRLTPAMVFESAYDSIRQSLTKPKVRDEFDCRLKEGFEKQDLISFGTTMDLLHDGASFSEQRPLMVSAPNVVVLDWIVEEDNAVSDMMTSILKPQYGRAEAVEPPTSLENLLQAYVEEEQLTGANQWRCPHCKKDVEATKQMHLWRSSDILIVHLKRFGVSDHGFRSRLNTFVDVPLGEVDFSPYFAPDSPFRDQNNRYRLYAVSNHTGGAHGGHYYAYCRPNDGDDWVEFNDSAVHDDVEPVITKAAYILFFRRVNDCPRTLENLRAADARCREDGEWMKDALSASAESRGACVVDPGAASVYAPAPSPVRTSYHSSLSDGEQDRDEKRENYEFYLI